MDGSLRQSSVTPPTRLLPFIQNTEKDRTVDQKDRTVDLVSSKSQKQVY
jgi:hypothetical protein